MRLRKERKDYFSAILKDKPRQERFLNIPERETKALPPLSNSVGNGFKRSVEDYKWKRDREESAATAKAIEEKKKRLASRPGKTIPPHVVDGMIEMMEFPQMDEGFDTIMVWAENHLYV